MGLTIIGIGLLNPENLTLKGLKYIKNSEKLYIYESSYQPYMKSTLESYLEKVLHTLTPSNVFDKLEELVEESQLKEVSVLMPGDPFCDLIYPKFKMKCINYSLVLNVVHNACLQNFVSNSGLQLYRFAETIYADTTMCVDQILETASTNMQKDLHTLIVFDSSLDTFEELSTALKQMRKCEKLLTGFVIVSILKSSLKISPLLLPDSDLSNYNSSSVRAIIIVGKCHEMEETLLNFGSSVINDSLKDRGIFHLIGLGLGEPEDITMKGQKAIADASAVFLEGYTSVMIGGKETLEDFFGKEIIVADRDMVESETHVILDGLSNGNVAFLVVGDPLGATTHTDLIIRATSEASSVDVIHNASIMNAVAVSGLNPNHFGEVTSIPFWEETWKPDSFYDKISSNFARGLHTLCLLDIKVKEQSLENLLRGRKIYEKPRFMTVSQAAEQLTRIIDDRESMNQSILLKKNASVVSLARIGTSSELIKLSTLEDTVNLDMGEPLHSLIITGNVSEEETIVLNTFR